MIHLFVHREVWKSLDEPFQPPPGLPETAIRWRCRWRRGVNWDGMDRDTVAAGLAVKFKDLIPYLPEAGRGSHACTR